MWFPYISETFIYRRVKTLIAKWAVVKYGNPSAGMFVIGVTGTDGKTTTCNLIHKIVNDNLGKALLISTANIKIWDTEQFNHYKMTSLDPAHLQAILASAKQAWCTYAVLEVASHGLAQNRFAGVSFDMWVLTNITPEHLDYHKTFENYVNTKKKLFTGILQNKKPLKYAVLPKDDETGRQWETELNFDKILTFSTVSSASIKWENIQLWVEETSFDVSYLGDVSSVHMPLRGKYNVYNALAAFAVGVLLGVPTESLIRSFASMQGVSGRMEKLSHKGINYFIDFAHTPNALENALKYVRAITSWRVIVVFGAPGKRDVFKRPEMWRIAHELADIVIVTDDDADDENRVSIITDIIAWIPRKEGEGFFILPEREFALKMAVELAQPGDTVLLAGKGHEQVHYTNFGKRKWNDKLKLEEILMQ